jgi:hypothetical protein
MQTIWLCICALLLSFSPCYARQPSPDAMPANLGGFWDVQVMNKHRKVIVAMKVSFSNLETRSCMSGSWKQVVVSAYKAKDDNFFPVNEPLAYRLDGKHISIGQVNVCDAYMMLDGKIAGNRAQGNYSAVSISKSELMGYFKARRRP